MKKRNYIYNLLIALSLLLSTPILQAQNHTTLPSVRITQGSIMLGVSPKADPINDHLIASAARLPHVVLSFAPPAYRAPHCDTVKNYIVREKPSPQNADKYIQALTWAVLFPKQIPVEAALVDKRLKTLQSKGDARQQDQIKVLQTVWEVQNSN